MLLLWSALTFGGEDVQNDMIGFEIDRNGALVGRFVLGRGRCGPGAMGPRSCTFHVPSPALPAESFMRLVRLAEGRQVGGWVDAVCVADQPTCAWLRGLYPGEAAALHVVSIEVLRGLDAGGDLRLDQ